MRYTMPAKLKSKMPEHMYNVRRMSDSMIRLRLHIVLKNELDPSRLKYAIRTSYYWRKCRRNIVAFYCSKKDQRLLLCPVFFLKRLPAEADTMRQIRDWNRSLTPVLYPA